MKVKPKGAKYRNLFARVGVIYYERVAHGRRIRLSTKTASWEDAAAFRDAFEAHKGIGKVPFFAGEVPRFAEFAERYLAEATQDLAGTTRDDRVRLLRVDGLILRGLGILRLDDITRSHLLEWYQAELGARGRAHSTGANYLSAISGVMRYAVDLNLLPENPVDALRVTLRQRRRTKRGRAASDYGSRRCPIDEAEALARFVAAAEQSPRAVQLATLLLLDAGLRLGEVQGLRWGDVRFGTGLDDLGRALLVRQSVARGKHQEAPKSGRERHVEMSRRLRRLLREEWLAAGQPELAVRVLPAFSPRTYEKQFTRLLIAAGLAGHSPKCLRHTFASMLLTAGIPLPFIALQLGHGSPVVTAAHYARWLARGYRAPLVPGPGEVAADLLTRPTSIKSPQSPPSGLSANTIDRGEESRKATRFR